MHFLLNRNQSRKSENVFSTLQSHKTDKIHLLARLGPFTEANDRFLYHFLYFNKWNLYTLICLNPEKDTPFRRSLPAKAIKGSAPPGSYAPLPKKVPFLNSQNN